MPTTKLYLAVISVSVLTMLCGCQGTLSSRPAIESSSIFAESADNSVTEVYEDYWARAPYPSTDSLYDPEMEESLSDIDVWTRIRNGFELSMPNKSLIKNQLQWYHDHPEHLPQIEERARPYLFYIVEELEKRGLPMEFALLPAIESAYEPKAVSSQNAAGIWQIMPSTGKLLGLEQNWWYDGRFDVLAATEAALDYLQYLADRFNGDWKLALAAYNAGEGTVQRAIKKNRELGKPTDYWSLDLPYDTKHYVPRLLALAKVVKEPEAFGTRLTAIPNEPYFDSINIDAHLDLRLAAEMADLPIDELHRLNPGLNSKTITPDDSHRLILPLENIEQFKQKLAALDEERPRYTIKHTVQPGDHLGGIAQRYGTTVAALQQANRLESTRILAGKELLIPKSADSIAARDSTTAEQPQSRAISSRKSNYTVRDGDTLWTIAKSHNVDLQQLAQWNGLTFEDYLQPGQQLIVLNAKQDT